MKNTIVLSAGGLNKELATYGIGIEHINELMIRMAMQLLREGHRLAFGGTLAVAGDDLTRHLIETAQNYIEEGAASKVDVNQPKKWPLVNYSAWPYYQTIDPSDRASKVGLCQFINIDPPNVFQATLQEYYPKWKEIPAARRCVADALTAMRDRSTKESDMRIVWGGRIAGAAGWLPGILEEIGFSLKHQKPVLILGGFGGCASLIADYLKSKSAAWPDELSLASCRDADRDALLSDTEQLSLKARFTAIQDQLAQYRDELHSNQTLHQIEPKLLRDALATNSPRPAIQIAAQVAIAIAQ